MDVHLVIYASGFEYLKGEEEIALLKNKWFPSSKDFELIAKESGDRILALESSDVLAKKLKETLQPNDILKEVSLIGHGDGSGLNLQGTLDPELLHGIQFFDRPDIFIGFDKSHRGEILSAINKRVKRDTLVRVYSCSSGIYYSLREGFLQTIANAFAIPSQGFKYPIEYCIVTSEITETIKGIKKTKEVRRIEDFFFDKRENRMKPSRGWVRYIPFFLARNKYEQKRTLLGENPCMGFGRTLNSLKKQIDSPIIYPEGFRSRKK